MVEVADPAGIINSLQARIRQLEWQIKAQHERQAEALAGAVGDTIRRLRMHGVILLQVSNGPMHRELAENKILSAAYDEVWKLDDAPLGHDIKTAIRVAAKNGMCRW
ncbi:MAG TPA: hypothetical protein VEC35_09380 [Noviherbaspirillum sp.]|nr:hypothetical protein [Noviherbaspirillum sp.]